jgi:hypothetical protein
VSVLLSVQNRFRASWHASAFGQVILFLCVFLVRLAKPCSCEKKSYPMPQGQCPKLSLSHLRARFSRCCSRKPVSHDARDRCSETMSLSPLVSSPLRMSYGVRDQLAPVVHGSCRTNYVLVRPSINDYVCYIVFFCSVPLLFVSCVNSCPSACFES